MLIILAFACMRDVIHDVTITPRGDVIGCNSKIVLQTFASFCNVLFYCTHANVHCMFIGCNDLCL